jgi:hypothetical protein
LLEEVFDTAGVAAAALVRPKSKFAAAKSR